MSFLTIAQMRIILTTETDADSPGSQELIDQFRENFEALLMLYAYAGFAETASENPTETVLTWTGSAQVVNDHQNRTLMITSGDAIGNMYTIDANAAQTITCTGDTLLADGVSSGDTFSVFFDLKVNADGHDHDGQNSKEIGIAIKGGGLDTGTDAVSGALAKETLLTVDMVDYSFFPNIYTSTRYLYLTGFNADSAGNDGRFGIYNSHTIDAANYAVRWRYMNVASAPMIFVIQDKSTGAIEHIYMAEKYKHVKKPKGFQSPLKLWQNGEQIDMSGYNEISVFNYPKAGYMEIRNKAEKDKKILHKFMSDDYEYDKTKKIFKPKNLLEV